MGVYFPNAGLQALRTGSDRLEAEAKQINPPTQTPPAKDTPVAMTATPYHVLQVRLFGLQSGGGAVRRGWREEVSGLCEGIKG